MKKGPSLLDPNGPIFALLKWLLVAGTFVLILASGVLGHAVIRDRIRSYHGVGLNPFSPRARPTPRPQGTPTAGPSPTPLPPVATPVPWNGKSRVTILLMGLDYRDWEAGSDAPRSDSMLLLTIDPLTQQAGMLSIPRDLWVEIPGFGHNRINTAYMFGEAYNLPGGGPALAVRTVENVIGVPIQFYAVVDFATFERLIDEIGGIDVLVKERIKISPIGRPSRWLEAKPYHLDGAEALAYARVRKGPGSGGDFGRAERQQQVALAVIDRVVGFDMIPTLIRKAPSLYQELAAGVRTNLSLEQMISLGWMAVQIPKENIRRGVIAPPNMVGFHTRPDGAQVLRPVPDQIRVLRDYIFVETSAIGPLSSGDQGEAP
jgi:LCP family protein required for cell wall assembly